MSLETETIRNIQREILGALSLLSADHKSLGVWQDSDNTIDESIESSGVIMTLEAMLCFLVPLHTFRQDDVFIREIFSVMSEDELLNEINEVIERMHGLSIPFDGNPYINVVDSSGKRHNFVDTACMYISLLLYSDEIFTNLESRINKAAAQKLFQDAIRFIAGSICISENRAQGWSFTDSDVPQRPYKYCTWMVADTLTDMIHLRGMNSKWFITDSSKQTINRLRSLLPVVLSETERFYLDGNLTDNEKKAVSGNVRLANGIIKEDPDDEYWHYNLWLILALLYLGSSRVEDIEDALGVLSDKIENRKFLEKLARDNCRIYFETDAFSVAATSGEASSVNQLTDRSFIAQYAKAVAIFITKFDREVDRVAELSSSLKLLLDNRKAGVACWDAESTKYAIYQTERAIEGLCWHAKALLNVAQQKPAGGDTSSANISNQEGYDLERMASIIATNAVRLEVGGEGIEELINRRVDQHIEKIGAERMKALREYQHVYAARMIDMASRALGSIEKATHRPIGEDDLKSLMNEVNQLKEELARDQD